MATYQKTLGKPTVDFSKPSGKMNHRLVSTNFAPVMSAGNRFNDAFKALRLEETRTHDLALNNRGQRVVDTHFIFPLEHLDANDPNNYYFKATDFLLKNIIDCGTNIYYRLGTSIEHTPTGNHFNTIIPKDFHHYADVCAGIVRHYNKGWADGYNWNIKYWEIWNEADLGERMWTGTKEEFLDFFVIVFKRLKSEFPEIKVGGPALCYLRMDWFRPLLERCKAENIVPDFISWHRYTADPYMLIDQGTQGRDLLDEYGFTTTETHLNEWHYVPPSGCNFPYNTVDEYQQNVNGPQGMHGIDSATLAIAAICGWHDTSLDASYFYGAGPASGSGGMYGFTTYYNGLNKNYYGFKLISDLTLDYPNRVSATGGNESQWLLAGVDETGKKGAFILVDYRGSFGDQRNYGSNITVQIDGIENPQNVKVIRLNNLENNQESDDKIENGNIILSRGWYGSAAFMVTFDIP